MPARRDFLQRSVLALGGLLPHGPQPSVGPELPLIGGVHPAPAVQRELDRSCFVLVHINPEVRVKVARGPARPVLARDQWRTFLVKVWNESGTTSALRVASPGAPFLELEMQARLPLSGSEVEYRTLGILTREAGRREATLAFDVGQGSQDLGFRNEVPVLFHCEPMPRG